MKFRHRQEGFEIQAEAGRGDGCASEPSEDFDFNSVGLDDGSYAGSISIFPNPSDGVLNITVLGAESPRSYVIMDLSGRTVTTGSFSPVLDLHSLNAGQYLLKLDYDEGQSVHRIILQ